MKKLCTALLALGLTLLLAGGCILLSEGPLRLWRWTYVVQTDGLEGAYAQALSLLVDETGARPYYLRVDGGAQTLSLYGWEALLPQEERVLVTALHYADGQLTRETWLGEPKAFREMLPRSLIGADAAFASSAELVVAEAARLRTSVVYGVGFSHPLEAE